MKFGYFNDSTKEYVIQRPDTPLPWMNYLGCDDYFGIITNTAGGYSFYKDARLRRLTRYRYNNVPLDYGGRYLYIRDDNSREFWSPTWQPLRRDLDKYECRHGLGYTTISSQFSSISTEIRYFVPKGENLEIWDFTISNDRDEAADLSIFSAIEFCLWDAWDDATNFQRNFSIGEVEVEGNVIYHKSEYRERRNHFAYFACSEDIAGFDTQREAFLGAYRGWDAPRVVEAGKSADSIAVGWQPIGSHHLKIALQPGEKKRVIFLLGYQENPQQEKFADEAHQVLNKTYALPKIEKYLDHQNVDDAFIKLRTYWDDLLSVMQVRTPNEHADRMVNIWNAYQVMATFNISRSASLFESGVGRGMGFRDSNQDLLAFCMLDPERARARILDLAAIQLESGGVYHQYQPLTKKGNNNVGSGFNDDPLWLVLSVAAYLKETADWSILGEVVPYNEDLIPSESLFLHLDRSLRYTLDRLGPHHLPLIGRGDWNDCLNLNSFSDSPGQSFQTTTNKDGKTAESVLIAGLFILAAREMAEIAARHARADLAEKYQKDAARMEQAIWEAGWDGDWFRRAYDYFGAPIGSKVNEEGAIFIEPQGMCIMAGLGVGDGKAQLALDSVADRLATEHGVLLQQPAYQKYYLHLGEISSYPPGYKENASVFCHTNPWIMIAETKVGNGDRAMDYYLRINPSNREGISDLHKCEPYVYAQMISGRDAPVSGEAKNSWLTGTAAWNYVAITQWILGIRPVYDGLEINPVVPAAWQEFTIQRKFRGTKLNFEFTREGAGNAVSLFVDGRKLEGNLIPENMLDGRDLDVRVVIT
jgi:cellobiose phosphorylase